MSWTGAGFVTQTDLGTLGGNESVANASNANGTVIVGHSSIGSDFLAFRYANGMMSNLNTLLTDAGVNMAGIVLADAVDISASGDYILAEDTAVSDSSFLVYYHDGVAGLTTAAEQQASVNALRDTRMAIAIQHDAYAGILTGDLDRHDQEADVGVFGLVGSAVGGVRGGAGLGQGFSISAGLLAGTSSFGGSSMNNAPMAAASLRYDTGMDLAGFEPFAQVGGSFGFLNDMTTSRPYTGGIGSGQADGSLASLYTRLGIFRDFDSGDQLTIAAELGNRWLSTNDYVEALSPTNPFPASIAAGTDRTTVGALATSWTHPLSDQVDLTLRAAVGAALGGANELKVSTIGFGTLTAGTNSSIWAEAGAHLSRDVAAQSSIDLYATARTGKDIGTNGHVGAGYHFRF